MEDVISYKPLIQDFVWSYSRLTSFQSCKWKFFLRYIRGIDEEEMFYASYGSYMHKIIEGFYKGKIPKDEMVTEFLIGYRENVSGARPGNVNPSSYIEKGIAYLKGFEPFPYDMVAVEEKLNFEIDGIKITGIIDYIGEKDGELYIVDNKSRDLKQRSGRKKPTVKDHELDEMLKQLYIYAIGVKEKYGKYPVALCFNCFKNREFIVEKFDEERCEEVRKWFIDSVHEIEDNEIWDDVDYEYMRCNYLCGLHNECDVYLDEMG